MARTTKPKAGNENVEKVEGAANAAEKKAADAKTVRDADAKVSEEKGMSVCEAFAALDGGKAVRREAWTKGVCIHTRRGETVPMYYINRYLGPYQPSIEDVKAQDWAIVIDFKE